MNLTNTENYKIGKNSFPTKLPIITFIILTFMFSFIIEYLIIKNISSASNTQINMYLIVFMWTPAFGAIITKLIFQKNLKGFGLYSGRIRWLFLGVLIPMIMGLFMFGAGWFIGFASFNAAKAGTIFSISYISLELATGILGAFGEELGWRGFLVPELSKSLTFSKLSIISGFIWGIWHIPLIIFLGYRGAYSLVISILMFLIMIIFLNVSITWLRLKSGSLWPAVLFHTFWNFSIQAFYPYLTTQTPTGDKLLGEFGWLAIAVTLIFAIIFWILKNKLPEKIFIDTISTKTQETLG